MGIARSIFYDDPTAADDDTPIVEAIAAICDEFEACGWRRVRAELRHRGMIVNHKKIRRLMREHDLQPRRRRRYVATTDSDHDQPIYPNRTKDLAVDGPNQLWVADITYVAIFEGLSTAPMHTFRAHTIGTGKSLLVDVAAAIATGRRCPVIAAGRTEEETERRLGALLRDGVSLISIDNVMGELGGAALAQMTERPLVRVRILGLSEAPEFECRSAVFATGNYLVLLGDMTRRTLVSMLDAQVERPELRQFQFDPFLRVLGNRAAYVAACLTISLAYRAAAPRN